MTHQYIKVFHNIYGDITQSLWIKALFTLLEDETYRTGSTAEATACVVSLLSSEEFDYVEVPQRRLFVEEFLDLRNSNFQVENFINVNQKLACTIQVRPNHCSIIGSPECQITPLCRILRFVCQRRELPPQVLTYCEIVEEPGATKRIKVGTLVIDAEKVILIDPTQLANLWLKANSESDPTVAFLRELSHTFPDNDPRLSLGEKILQEERRLSQKPRSTTWIERHRHHYAFHS